MIFDLNSELKRLDEIGDVRPLKKDEINFLFTCVKSADPAISCHAAVILSGEGQPVIKRLCEEFTSYSHETQKAIIPLLSCSDVHEPFYLFFQLLKNGTHPHLNDAIIYALGRTDYEISAILLSFMYHAPDDFMEDLKLVIQIMGFDRIAPYLALFPVIPYERVFRDLFGDKKVDSLYSTS